MVNGYNDTFVIGLMYSRPALRVRLRTCKRLSLEFSAAVFLSFSLSYLYDSYYYYNYLFIFVL